MWESKFKNLLILVTLLVITTPCYAGIISVPSFSADSSVSHLETFRTTVVNVINGNIQGAGGTGANRNIAADSVAELDMYDDANPRIFSNELLSVGSDTFSSGTLTQNSFVKSGGTIATSASLSSTITACIYYVNGYRISLGATAETFQASMDTYVDLSQSGVVTLSPVANGATQPAVAANSARIAKVVTDGTTITTSTDLANRRLPGLTVSANYRDGLVISKDSSTTITVLPGTCEINNTMLTKTTTNTLTISTAGNWAGGSSLRAADTFGFVGMDSSGNLKLHTTAPTNDNYAVSTTQGKKRYATWSSTVYRILGWFYMDGSQNVEVASNIKEGGLANKVMTNDSTTFSTASTSFVDSAKARFYNSGGDVMLFSIVSADASGGSGSYQTELFDGSTDIPFSGVRIGAHAAGVTATANSFFLQQNVSQATRTYTNKQLTDGTTFLSRRRSIVVEER